MSHHTADWRSRVIGLVSDALTSSANVPIWLGSMPTGFKVSALSPSRAVERNGSMQNVASVIGPECGGSNVPRPTTYLQAAAQHRAGRNEQAAVREILHRDRVAAIVPADLGLSVVDGLIEGERRRAGAVAADEIDGEIIVAHGRGDDGLGNCGPHQRRQ